MYRGPKNLATSPAVGGTVESHDTPSTTANRRNVSSVFGATRNTATATARVAYTSESSVLKRQRFIDQPIAKLPIMLPRPITPSDHAPTDAGSWHASTTPGRCVEMNATWKPQVKNPAFSSR